MEKTREGTWQKFRVYITILLADKNNLAIVGNEKLPVTVCTFLEPRN